MKKFILTILTFVIALCPMLAVNNVAYAEAEVSAKTIDIEEDKAYNYLVDFVSGENKNEPDYQKRQQIRANYLKETIVSMGYDVSQIKEESFSYINRYINNNTVTTERAVNLVVTKKAKIDTNKFIIISANYDNAEGLTKNILNTDGTSSNGVGVATVLAIMDELKYVDLDFNIEFVFFAASEVGLQGSQYYVDQIKTANRFNDLLLMINIWGIGAGDNSYLYDDEMHWQHYDYIYNIAKENNLGFNKMPTDKKVIAAPEPNIGLEYNHQALLSDVAPFIAKRLPTISLFSGNYTNKGFVQSKNYGNIAGTSNDTIEKFNEIFGNKGKKQMNNAVELVTKIVTNEVFTTKMLSSINNKPDYTNFSTHNDTIVIATGVVVGLILLAMVIGYIIIKNRADKSNDPIKPLYIDIDQFVGPNGTIKGIDDEQDTNLDPFGLDDDKEHKNNNNNNDNPFGL